jgi:gas vesicle protein
MTKTFRNRMFLQGILFGGLMGLIVGTLVAFQVGNERIDDARDSMRRWARRNKSPINYKDMLV